MALQAGDDNTAVAAVTDTEDTSASTREGDPHPNTIHDPLVGSHLQAGVAGLYDSSDLDQCTGAAADARGVDRSAAEPALVPQPEPALAPGGTMMMTMMTHDADAQPENKPAQSTTTFSSFHPSNFSSSSSPKYDFSFLQQISRGGLAQQMVTFDVDSAYLQVTQENIRERVGLSNISPPGTLVEASGPSLESLEFERNTAPENEQSSQHLFFRGES